MAGRTHRTSRTPFAEEWLSRESATRDLNPDDPILEYSEISGQSIPIYRFMSVSPNASIRQNIDSMALLMEQSAGLVNEIKHAVEIPAELVSEAEKLLTQH